MREDTSDYYSIPFFFDNINNVNYDYIKNYNVNNNAN